jgi:alpha-tubulin suppressor-like RCC1 family protein
MVEVEGGYDFTCSRKSDGTVWCWGKDDFGQLGDGGFGSDQTVARKVYGLTNAADICVGYQHACAVKSDGKMFCWGNGADDRLGFGSTGDQFSPVEVKNISNAVSCSLGTSHSCVKLSDKTTRCWGNAASGQLGNGQLSTTKMTIPVSVYGISNAAQISAGGSHACAVLDNGSIACWGLGVNGELGNGIIGTKLTPDTVKISGTFTQVSAGYYYTCALKNDGTVWCFGDNSYGQLGDNSTTDRFSAVQVSNITNARQISTGHGSSCALLTDNTTKCWGHNNYGQLGDNSTTDRLTPVNVKLSDGNNLDNVSSISSNKYTSCAVLNSNSAHCWGYGAQGQIGVGSYNNFNYATLINYSSITFNLIANGPSFTCGIITDGSVRCWGLESYGERGDSVSGNSRITPDTTVHNISSAIDLDLGEYHACSIDNSSKIWCWGRNNYGQIGFGSSTSEYTSPVEVIGITNAVEVDLGGEFSCARLSDKTVKCWGYLANGRLGYGVGPVSAPVYNVSAAKEISMGTNHSCVLNDNGTVKCWGEGDNGRLGDGYQTDRTYPVDVYNLSNASQIVTGYDFTCALRSDSNIACWGNNTDGIAGTWGELTYTPTNIPSISDVKALDAGNSHVCALLNSGGIKCWGSGTHGQLGNLIASTNETPQTVYSIDSATSIGLGKYHSCAVLDNNYVVCWGWGGAGQLGNNKENSNSIPVRVRSQ